MSIKTVTDLDCVIYNAVAEAFRKHVEKDGGMIVGAGRLQARTAKAVEDALRNRLRGSLVRYLYHVLHACTTVQSFHEFGPKTKEAEWSATLRGTVADLFRLICGRGPSRQEMRDMGLKH